MTNKHSLASIARLKKVPPEERSRRASLGGIARWKGKNKKERIEHAKMMVQKRENARKLLKLNNILK